MKKFLIIAILFAACTQKQQPKFKSTPTRIVGNKDTVPVHTMHYYLIGYHIKFTDQRFSFGNCIISTDNPQIPNQDSIAKWVKCDNNWRKGDFLITGIYEFKDTASLRTFNGSNDDTTFHAIRNCK